MKPTGKINPITGDEILRAEESDITFLDKEWDELSDNEKATFLSFLDVRFLSQENEFVIKGWFEYYKAKNE